MADKNDIRFPSRFLWGAATAAHQVEGNTHNQWTVWELENAKSLAAQAEYQYGDLANWPDIKLAAKDPKNYVSDKLADHYHKYEMDFDILRKLNLNAYRFSVEWSRIEPREGVWDASEIEHYKKYVAALKNRDIEPMLTLFHFTLPVWFTDKEGFAKRQNIKFFVRFAEKIIRELGSDIRYVITINEPETYAWESYQLGHWPPQQTKRFTALRVLNNLAITHNKTAKMIHGLSRRYKVSVAKNSANYYPGDDARLSRWTANFQQWATDDYFLKKVRRHCDFLGVNYYFSNQVYGYRIHNTNEKMSDLGEDLSPANLQFVLERLHDKYRKPIIITENGLADAHDKKRKWWLAETLSAMQQALDYGVRLEGYFHWSLIDNFEWDKGRWPRFGLVEISYDTGKRKVRSSAITFSKVIKRIQRNAK